MKSSKTTRRTGCRELLQWARTELPPLEAEVLVAHCVGMDRFNMLLAQDDIQVEPETVMNLINMILSRQAGEPVGYLIGKKDFYGRTFFISNAVLIPRPDTETVVERALELLPENRTVHVIDVCTGSGCIASTIAAERPLAEVTATDISEQALEVAKHNVRQLGLAARVECRQGDLLEACSQMRDVDMVIANPPYIKEEDFEGLMRDVRDYEPKLALIGKGASGLGHHEGILLTAYPLLKEGGYVVLEIGFDQKEAISQLQMPGYLAPEVFSDLAGHPRGVIFVKESMDG